MNMITVITDKNIGTKIVISMIWSCFGLNEQWQERFSFKEYFTQI